MTTTRFPGLRLLAVLAALVLGASACSSGDNGGGGSGGGPSTTLTGPDAGKSLKTVSAGKLTACTHVPNAPYEFEDAGQFDGIDMELVRAVAGRLALPPEFVKVDSADALVSSLDSGKCDIVAAAIPITPEQSAKVGLSDSYLQVSQSLLVRKGEEATLNDLPALSGKTVGVKAGSAGAAYAKASVKGATIKELASADELFAALKAKQVDAVVQDLPVNAYNATSTGETAVAKVFTDADKQPFGLAMKKGSDDLKQAIDGALVAVKSDDTFPTILRRFLGDSAGQAG